MDFKSQIKKMFFIAMLNCFALSILIKAVYHMVFQFPFEMFDFYSLIGLYIFIFYLGYRNIGCCPLTKRKLLIMILSVAFFIEFIEIYSFFYLEDLIEKKDYVYDYFDLGLLLFFTLPSICFIMNKVEQQRKVEIRLIDSETQARRIFDNLDEIIVWSRDIATEQVYYCSKGVKSLTGYTAEEIRANSINWAEHVHYDDQATIMKAKTLVFQGETQKYKYRFFDKDNKMHWFKEQAFPVYNDKGQLTRYDGIVYNITDMIKKTEELEESEKRYRLIADFIPEAFAVHVNNEVVYMNHAGFQLLGANQFEDIQGLTIWDIIDSRFHDDLKKRSKKQPVGTINSLMEMKLLRLDGKVRDVEVISIHMTYDGEPALYAVYRDITDQKEAQAQIKFLAYHDSLTGLANRFLFEKKLNDGISHTKDTVMKLAVMYIDIDRFKWINDTLGHDIGDKLLKQFSQRLVGAVKKTDIVARQGGDEFVVILSNINHLKDIVNVAERIIETVKKPYMIDGNDIEISCSIGIAIYPDDGVTTNMLMKNADAALYNMKQLGRNGFSFFTKEIQETIIGKMALEFELRKGLTNNQFELYFQPQINTKNNEIVGVEALIRWNHPLKGVVSPGTFIKVAEETGFIIDLGYWVIEEACRQLKFWHEKLPKKIKVAINISSEQFKQTDFVDRLYNIILTHDIDPSFIDLEMTETISVLNVEDVLAKLNALKELGFTISIDDFGTGFSSLAYIKKFPVDTIKVAQQFVSELTAESGDKEIVAAIVAMANSLNLMVIAEGVETKEQLDYLHSLSCHLFQGYLFSKPLDRIAFEHFFHSFNGND